MNCEEFEELAGAYAFDALTAEERAMAEAHLAGCDKHPEIAELAAVANSLALATEEIEPPTGLKSRLMAIVEAEAEESSRASVREPRKRGLGEVVSGWFRSPRLGYGAASVMAVLVTALLVWNISLQGGGSNQVVVQMNGEATGQLTYLKDQKLAVIQLSGLAAIPDDKVYEVWAITENGIPSPVGTFRPVNGSATASMPMDATAVHQIGITVEEAPSAAAPTSAPIISGEF